MCNWIMVTNCFFIYICKARPIYLVASSESLLIKCFLWIKTTIVFSASYCMTLNQATGINNVMSHCPFSKVNIIPMTMTNSRHHSKHLWRTAHTLRKALSNSTLGMCQYITIYFFMPVQWFWIHSTTNNIQISSNLSKINGGGVLPEHRGNLQQTEPLPAVKVRQNQHQDLYLQNKLGSTQTINQVSLVTC